MVLNTGDTGAAGAGAAFFAPPNNIIIWVGLVATAMKENVQNESLQERSVQKTSRREAKGACNRNKHKERSGNELEHRKLLSGGYQMLDLS
jgi:hypothetical protein